MVRGLPGSWVGIGQGGSTGWYARGTVCGQDVSPGLGSVPVHAECVGMHCVEIVVCKLDVVMYGY